MSNDTLIRSKYTFVKMIYMISCRYLPLTMFEWFQLFWCSMSVAMVRPRRKAALPLGGINMICGTVIISSYMIYIFRIIQHFFFILSLS